jgi:hypothetical protein
MNDRISKREHIKLLCYISSLHMGDTRWYPISTQTINQNLSDRFKSLLLDTHAGLQYFSSLLS